MTTLQLIIKKAKALRAASPKKFAKWTDYVKAASATIKPKKKATVGAIKKKAVKKAATKKVVKKAPVKKVVKKAATKKATSIHKDTKSHNVRISVVSGISKAEKEINKNLLDELNSILNKIKNAEEIREKYKIAIKYNQIEKEDKVKARGIIKFYTANIKEYKDHFRKVKAQLK